MARQPAGLAAARGRCVEEYEYDGIETCAADGTCALACPLGIDTGQAGQGRSRGREHGDAGRAHGAARGAALGRRSSARRAPGCAPATARRQAADEGRERGARARRSATSWSRRGPTRCRTPRPAELPPTRRDGAAAVYMPACINRIFGARRAATGRAPACPRRWSRSRRAPGCRCGSRPTSRATAAACRGARRATRDGHAAMANGTRSSALWRWSDGGELPVVIDASSCTHGLGREMAEALEGENAERHAKLEILDSIAWAHDRLLPNLEVGAQARLGRRAPDLLGAPPRPVAEARRDRRRARRRGHVPPQRDLLRHGRRPRPAPSGADRGRDGRRRRPSSAAARFDAHLCSNRTCEIGLQQGTGRAYESFVFALEAATRPR